ncbi:MAG: hypothetical protein COU06_00325 [Candidatus Harrisonbacteria bacterium CG10_big_fil_rev_8_21_14_0_10_38_8]|uniref:UDP-N-acetylmuramoyl-tripeptide--D-alanyl-D-alanine ligase n=1 Tax=Candidatus Harrisonbacteria bacterium CG10_big_fil_rev_8_21_14_0_10_38_8 TaxID=1974582 RepID=A0A2M6WKZ6_9BACT|nr:MAG: hypothetical protein COU06_00325 [Candidatus Harrisonbacteria bacterium CG10_big_fil_rev_8_21_14_0_10_38_8]
MKLYLKTTLIKILRILSRLTIKKFNPEIIGVTGTAGKTSAKEAIYSVLRSQWQVRATHDNYNNEIGLPLTILGNYKKTGGFSFWIPVIIICTLRLCIPRKLLSYPDILVLEYAADRPGDIKYLISIAKPHISIVTAIGEIPVHVEFYEDIGSVIREKAKLIDCLNVGDLAILNMDDKKTFEMKDKTRAKIVTYGFNNKADIRLSNFETKTEKIGRANKPIGISFKLEYKESFIPIRVPGTIGKAQAYAIAAATAVGIHKNMHLIKISEALSYYQPIRRRTSIVYGYKNSVIIDDSYNSSPLALENAIEAVKEIQGKRKIAILGDMRELGSYSNKAHKQAGRSTAKVFSHLITIGTQAKIIADEAVRVGMNIKNVETYESVEELLPEIRKKIRSQDIVLAKGSLAIGIYKLVDELTREREPLKK